MPRNKLMYLIIDWLVVLLK